MLFLSLQLLFPLGRISTMIYGVLASIIFCGYILYDTDNLIKRDTPTISTYGLRSPCIWMSSTSSFLCLLFLELLTKDIILVAYIPRLGTFCVCFKKLECYVKKYLSSCLFSKFLVIVTLLVICWLKAGVLHWIVNIHLPSWYISSFWLSLNCYSIFFNDLSSLYCA